MLKKAQRVQINKEALIGKRVTIIRSLFNEELTGSLLQACKVELSQAGMQQDQISVYEVPGALEIPIIAKLVAQQDLADVIIALGVIIKGDTYHFELVANECARGCTIVSQEFTIPVIFEVLAVNNLTQARERAGNNGNNKGIEAARSALKMLEVINDF